MRIHNNPSTYFNNHRWETKNGNGVLWMDVPWKHPPKKHYTLTHLTQLTLLDMIAGYKWEVWIASAKTNRFVQCKNNFLWESYNLQPIPKWQLAYASHVQRDRGLHWSLSKDLSTFNPSPNPNIRPKWGVLNDRVPLNGGCLYKLKSFNDFQKKTRYSHSQPTNISTLI